MCGCGLSRCRVGVRVTFVRGSFIVTNVDLTATWIVLSVGVAVSLGLRVWTRVWERQTRERTRRGVEQRTVQWM
jgi:hypothetical protein